MTTPTRSPLLVTAAIISGDRGLLIARRKSDSSCEPGKWEFPGGKVEFGESPEICLAREIREELALEIKIDGLFAINSHVYLLADRQVHIVLLCYSAHVIRGEPEALEVDEVKWIRPADLDRYEFAAADLPFVAKLKQTLR